VVSAVHGQYVESTIYLPDSVSGLHNVNSLLFHSPSNTMYVGGDDYFLVAVDAQTNAKLTKVGLGGGPHLLCSDAPGNKVYCTNYSGSVTVVDGATNQSIKTIPVERYVTELIYVERANKVYMGNASDTLLRVIDCATDLMAARIPVGPCPQALCHNPRLNRVYCVNSNDDVVVIDCAADTVVGTIWMRGVGPHDICYDSATDCVYTTNSASASVSVIDCAGDSFVRLVPVGRKPGVISAGPPGKVYCANYSDSSVAVVSGSGVETIRTCPYPRALSYDPVNNKVYCACEYSNTVTVIDAATDSVIARVRTGYSYYTAALCHNPAGNNTYVACGRDDVVDAIGGVSDSVEAVITFWSCSPGPLCYNTTNNQLYCLDRQNNLLFVIDSDSNRILKILKTGIGSEALIWSSASNKVYFANTEDSTVSVLDCASDSIVATVTTGYQPNALCCSDDGRVYVANDEGGVAIVDGAGDTVRAVIPAGRYVRALCYDRTDNRVYFRQYYGDTVRAIDVVGDSVVATIPLPASAGGAICWNQNHDKLYMCCPSSESVTVIDCRGDTVLGSVGVSTGLGLMYSDSVCDKVYCADRWNGYLRIIQASTDTLCANLYVGYVTAITDNGKRGPANRLYCTVADRWADQVAVVHTYKTDTVLRSISVGYRPGAVAWNPAYSRIYVSNRYGSSISVIRDTLSPGVEEAMNDERGTMNNRATVVRGVLLLPQLLPLHSSLLSSDGRKVMHLSPGANDVRALAPGVYFVREEPQAAGHKPQAVRKVVLTE